MKPILIRFANDAYIHSGHFMLFLGGLAAVILLALEMRRTGEKPEKIYPLLFLLLISTLLGARLLYCMDFNDKFQYSLVDVLKFWRGGLALHGGAVFAVATGVLYIHWRQLDFWKIADLFTPPVALFIALARVGCILTGCCYGKPCDPDFPLAVTFTDYAALAPRYVPLYPTQAWFAATALLRLRRCPGEEEPKGLQGRDRSPRGLSLFPPRLHHRVLPSRPPGPLRDWRGCPVAKPDHRRGCLPGGDRSVLLQEGRLRFVRGMTQLAGKSSSGKEKAGTLKGTGLLHKHNFLQL